MKTNNSFSSLFKKIIYFLLIFTITAFLILFSIKKVEKLEDLKLKTLSFYFPFTITAKFGFSPFLVLQNEDFKSQDCSKISDNFTQIILEKSEILHSNIKNFNQIAENLKFNIVLIKPIYYSSSGFLTDVIFANPNLEGLQITENLPVISSEGLFGRIASVNQNIVSIVPIFDELSSIPVYTKQSNIYGTASGDGFNLEFIYLNQDISNLIDGEIVLTSGENNLTISEIPVGIIKKENDKIIIKAFAKRRLPILGIITKK